MDSLVLQYIIIALAILAACYSLFRTLRKAFTKSDKKGGCNTDCGCS